MSTHRQDDEFNRELMEDFFLDFRDAHQNCENTLIDLEQDPTNPELLNALFRSVHTIKGNLVYVGLKDLTPLIQSVEDVLDAVRKHSLRYDASLSDVIMLAMDKTKAMVEARMNSAEMPLNESQLTHLCQQISRITELDAGERTKLTSTILSQLDPSTQLVQPATTGTRRKADLPLQPDENTLLQAYNIEADDDIRFFQHMSQPLEERSRYWKGRAARQLQLALAMNQLAGDPVEPAQLAAAVYMHDIAMAFLPIAILHKTTSLTAEEFALLHDHPIRAWQLLAPMTRWQQASLIVKEHHERIDGNGYPQQLQGDSICPGAKIMAIVDAFDARTHERAYSAQIKRPFIRAILEINRCSGSQFAPEWVDVFNEVARRLQNQP